MFVIKLYLVLLFNTFLNQQISELFPHDFKITHFCIDYKVRNKNWGDYRPVFLLQVTSKVFRKSI